MRHLPILFLHLGRTRIPLDSVKLAVILLGGNAFNLADHVLDALGGFQGGLIDSG